MHGWIEVIQGSLKVIWWRKIELNPWLMSPIKNLVWISFPAISNSKDTKTSSSNFVFSFTFLNLWSRIKIQFIWSDHPVKEWISFKIRSKRQNHEKNVYNILFWLGVMSRHQSSTDLSLVKVSAAGSSLTFLGKKSGCSTPLSSSGHFGRPCGYINLSLKLQMRGQQSSTTCSGSPGDMFLRNISIILFPIWISKLPWV